MGGALLRSINYGENMKIQVCIKIIIMIFYYVFASDFNWKIAQRVLMQVLEDIGGFYGEVMSWSEWKVLTVMGTTTQ